MFILSARLRQIFSEQFDQSAYRNALIFSDSEERVQRILEIANSTEGPLKTADEIEELLLEEMRRLGNESMSQWATQAEKRVGQELKQQDPTVLKRKKKR